MPPRGRYTSKPSTSKKSSGGGGPPGRGRTAPSQAARESAQRANRESAQRQEEQRRNVREQARQPDRPTKTAQQRAAESMKAAGISSLSGTQGLSGKAVRLENEFNRADDDRKKEIVSELKDVRSQLNVENKERAVQNLLKEAAGPGTPGLVARDSSGNIITDSSGNPIMTGRGSDVFQQGRQGFRDEAGRLLQESPELYRKMYPMAYAAQKGIPAMMEYMPGLGMPLRIARSALGKARGFGQGIMGTRLAQDLTSAPRRFLGDIRSMFGGFGQGFRPTSSINADIQGDQPSDRGGVIDAAQSMVNQQSPYGGWIGRDPNMVYTTDFIDSDGDGVDDRWQTGPGTPNMNPALGGEFEAKKGVIGGMPGMYQPGYGGSIGREYEARTAVFQDRDRDQIDDRDQAGPGQPHWRGSMGQGQKFATPGLPHPITLPQAPFPRTDIAASQAAGYDIPMAPSALTPGSALAMSPMTHQLQFQQSNPNWQQWYQNVGKFS